MKSRIYLMILIALISTQFSRLVSRSSETGIFAEASSMADTNPGKFIGMVSNLEAKDFKLLSDADRFVIYAGFRRYFRSEGRVPASFDDYRMIYCAKLFYMGLVVSGDTAARRSLIVDFTQLAKVDHLASVFLVELTALETDAGIRLEIAGEAGKLLHRVGMNKTREISAGKRSFFSDLDDEPLDAQRKQIKDLVQKCAEIHAEAMKVTGALPLKSGEKEASGVESGCGQ